MLVLACWALAECSMSALIPGKLLEQLAGSGSILPMRTGKAAVFILLICGHLIFQMGAFGRKNAIDKAKAAAARLCQRSLSPGCLRVCVKNWCTCESYNLPVLYRCLKQRRKRKAPPDFKNSSSLVWKGLKALGDPSTVPYKKLRRKKTHLSLVWKRRWIRIYRHFWFVCKSNGGWYLHQGHLRAWGVSTGMRIRPRFLRSSVLEPNPEAPEHSQVLPGQVYPQRWLCAAGDPIPCLWAFLEKQWLNWSSSICLCLEIQRHGLTFP